MTSDLDGSPPDKILLTTLGCVEPEPNMRKLSPSLRPFRPGGSVAAWLMCCADGDSGAFLCQSRAG